MMGVLTNGFDFFVEGRFWESIFAKPFTLVFVVESG